MKDKNLYAVLGIDQSATKAEIKAAFKKLASQYHPDKSMHSDDPETTARFQEIQNAYEVLSDDEKRRVYDSGGDPFQRVVSAEEQIESEAMMRLIALFDSMVEQLDEMSCKKVDVTDLLRNKMTEIIGLIHREKRGTIRALRKQRQVRRRLKADDFITGHLHSKRVALIAEWKVHRFQMRVAHKVLELVNGMEYETDPKEEARPQFQFIGLDFGSSATGARW